MIYIFLLEAPDSHKLEVLPPKAVATQTLVFFIIQGLLRMVALPLLRASPAGFFAVAPLRAGWSSESSLKTSVSCRDGGEAFAPMNWPPVLFQAQIGRRKRTVSYIVGL
jgi:hypothetical protein